MLLGIGIHFFIGFYTQKRKVNIIIYDYFSILFKVHSSAKVFGHLDKILHLMALK